MMFGNDRARRLLGVSPRCPHDSRGLVRRCIRKTANRVLPVPIPCSAGGGCYFSSWGFPGLVILRINLNRWVAIDS